MQDSPIHEEAGPEGARVSVSRADILAEITDICQPLTLILNDEVTISGMASIWGCSTSTAQTSLDRRVKEGRLTRRKALFPETGREGWAYRVVS